MAVKTERRLTNSSSLGWPGTTGRRSAETTAAPRDLRKKQNADTVSGVVMLLGLVISGIVLGATGDIVWSLCVVFVVGLLICMVLGGVEAPA